MGRDHLVVPKPERATKSLKEHYKHLRQFLAATPPERGIPDPDCFLSCQRKPDAAHEPSGCPFYREGT